MLLKAIFWPSGRPRCDIRTTEAPLSRAYLIVGSAAVIRCVLVMAPVALSIMDPDNPYRYLQVRGTVSSVTEEGADAHIDSLAKKYLGKDTYPFRQPGEIRVMYEIEPTAASGMG